MFSLDALIVISSVVIVQIHGNMENCKLKPPEVENAECCVLPKIYSDEDLKACDVKFDLMNLSDLKENWSDMCEILICLLKRINAMTNDKEINVEVVKKYLQKFAETEKEWGETVSIVSEHCFGPELEKLTALSTCQPVQNFFCTLIVGYLHCPKSHWKDSDDCKKVAAYLDSCSE